MRLALVASLAVMLVASSGSAQVALPAATEELRTVQAAQQVVDEFGRLHIDSIPPAMLGTAQGIAIFPNMLKGGFILGVNFGKGVLLVRRGDGTWSPPTMVTMGGGSLGFQAGVQAADIVLVFATPRSLEGMLRGEKVTLGADANVALGPIGRSANAGTDARLGAEIYSYARSRGLFVGVSVNGASLSLDNNANAMLYGRGGVTPADIYQARGLAYHAEVASLIADVTARALPPQVPATAAKPAPVAAPAAAAPAVPVRPVAAPVQPPSNQPPAAYLPPEAPPATVIPPLIPIQRP
ncbi:MAG: lipid-binding SYLF domain-containing protein [Planctomycetes bacterium]|nr:lipid-binding SYLF domain-containing protein [Planctomycetota bacterium]